MCNLTSVHIQPQLYRICTNPFQFVVRPTKVRFNSKNILEIPFVTRDTVVPGTVQTCKYHHLEQFRITVLDNITLLIEDLSPLVSSGTRMFFTTRNVSTEVPENQCPCRNVRRDQKRFNSCEKYIGWMIRNKELIQREADRSARELRIAVAITVGSLVGNVIGRWWVTWKFQEYKCIASIVLIVTAVD
ncbi:hypothetical protein pipiens_001094 [Culex pipiens pipiens]|uniref:Uncharacterized protein n=1 Tax=Culex pipiens pipiens TaxID=38569 RepID=A0ABD1CL95_CULPP